MPWSQLEQDWAEGKQGKGSAYEPWRNMNTRKAIYERKVMVYTMLHGRKETEELNAFMKSYTDYATDQVEASRRLPGKSKEFMNCLCNQLKAFFVEKYMSPFHFEKDVLLWKHTDSAAKQAQAKQQR